MNEKLLGAYLYSQIRIRKFGETAKEKVSEIFTDETGDVNVVAIVVLIGVVVLLAILFKDQVGKLLKTLFGAIGGKANDAIDTAPATE